MDSTYHENYRPQFHFSPEKNWTNDPNGLVYYEGEYHIFYQYNPYGTTWGHMSWGHAVSKDLMHWEQLPVAITEYQDAASGDSTMIFSGTVVVDKDNSSGLCEGKDCIIAIYTSHVHKDNQGLAQHQSLAYSNDKGRTWHRYTKNPILDIKRKDFRDPKVFWYEPTRQWVMVAVIPDLFKVQFYSSVNLLNWTLTGEFGGIGDLNKIWECPDLYQLPIDNQPGKSKWVLSLSGSHPAQGPFVGMQYFVGDFNGATFIAENPKQYPLYVDYGKDFYAGIVFNNLPNDNKHAIMVGWANNWAYGNQIPTYTWRSAMSLPRELSLKDTPTGIRLIQQPLAALTTLRDTLISDTSAISGKALELEVEITANSSKQAGLTILKGDGEETLITYHSDTRELSLDRTHSGKTGFNKDFPSVERVKIDPVNGKVNLHLYIDHSIVEIFINFGEQTLCEQIFPTNSQSTVTPYSDNGSASFAMKAWKMKSTWR